MTVLTVPRREGIRSIEHAAMPEFMGNNAYKNSGTRQFKEVRLR